jgi:hypothetical protein
MRTRAYLESQEDDEDDEDGEQECRVLSERALAPLDGYVPAVGLHKVVLHIA